MSQTVSTVVQGTYTATETVALGGATGPVAPSFTSTTNLANGSGSGQVNLHYEDASVVLPAQVTAPSDTPTVNVTGGGAGGGSLQAGAYYLKRTFANAFGETTVGPESAQFTVAAGNQPQVTWTAPPAGCTSKLYLTAAGGASGTETLYASGISGTTYVLSAAQSAGAAMPSSNTTNQKTYVLSALTDQQGRPVAFTKIRAFHYNATSRTAGDYTNIGNAGTHPVVMPWGTGARKAYDYCPEVIGQTDGIAVAAGSADQLLIANAGANAITYNLGLSGI